MCHKQSLGVKVIYIPQYLYQLIKDNPNLPLSGLLDLEGLAVGLPEDDLYRYMALQEGLFKITTASNQGLFNGFDTILEHQDWASDRLEDYSRYKTNLKAIMMKKYVEDHPSCFSLCDLGRVDKIHFDKDKNILYLINTEINNGPIDEHGKGSLYQDETDLGRYRQLLQDILTEIGSRRLYDVIAGLPMFEEFVNSEIFFYNRVYAARKTVEDM